MKNGSGDYLWKQTDEAQQIGATGTLLGYPLFEDEQLPDIAAGSLSIAFGNFQRGYTIVDRNTMMLRDPFTNKPYVNFYSSRRVGGAVRDTRAIKLLKFAAS
jgi:HK97 family phage major capsid protein